MSSWIFPAVLALIYNREFLGSEFKPLYWQGDLFSVPVWLSFCC